MIVQRTNTILYCGNWTETVDFYRDIFSFNINHQTDWFVEFQVTFNSYLSVANAERATIHSVNGQGITLSWQVSDIRESHTALEQLNIGVTAIKKKWGSWVVYLQDPEGHRIELWQPVSDPIL